MYYLLFFGNFDERIIMITILSRGGPTFSSRAQLFPCVCVCMCVCGGGRQLLVSYRNPYNFCFSMVADREGS